MPEMQRAGAITGQPNHDPFKRLAGCGLLFRSCDRHSAFGGAAAKIAKAHIFRGPNAFIWRAETRIGGANRALPMRKRVALEKHRLGGNVDSSPRRAIGA